MREDDNMMYMWCVTLCELVSATRVEIDRRHYYVLKGELPPLLQ